MGSDNKVASAERKVRRDTTESKVNGFDSNREAAVDFLCMHPTNQSQAQFARREHSTLALAQVHRNSILSRAFDIVTSADPPFKLANM